jgi:hypothetical protein
MSRKLGGSKLTKPYNRQWLTKNPVELLCRLFKCTQRFARLEEFFIDDRRWQGMREDFFRRSGLPSDSKQVPEYLARRLGEAYERFLKTAPSTLVAGIGYYRPDPRKQRTQSAKQQSARTPIGCVSRFDTVGNQ